MEEVAVNPGMKNAIIIFVRKPELGKVKTRLAADIGEKAALAVYERLLFHTHEILAPLAADKFVYYHEAIDENDLWHGNGFRKKIQASGGLGEKMNQAFTEVFEIGYERVLIIGSDCPELDHAVLEQAFAELEKKEVVIGPATDGGYYLLGMTKLFSQLFKGKEWSTQSVYASTIDDLLTSGISFATLKELNDVDHASDLPPMYTEELKKLHLM